MWATLTGSPLASGPLILLLLFCLLWAGSSNILTYIFPPLTLFIVSLCEIMASYSIMFLAVTLVVQVHTYFLFQVEVELMEECRKSPVLRRRGAMRARSPARRQGIALFPGKKSVYTCLLYSCSA